MSDIDFRNKLIENVMDSLIEVGLVDKLINKDIEASMRGAQDFLDALTVVSGSIIASHLMARMADGEGPDTVSVTSQNIINIVAANLTNVTATILVDAVQELNRLASH